MDGPIQGNICNTRPYPCGIDPAGALRAACARLNTPLQLAVIGGGPAGLRAAEVAAAAGMRVTVFDAKPSVGRKFLVAGKGGLNLTHGEESVDS